MQEIWTEKYRPSTFSDMVGQEIIIERVMAMAMYAEAKFEKPKSLVNKNPIPKVKTIWPKPAIIDTLPTAFIEE